MREILFRGKRTDNAEWVKGSLFQEDGWTAVGEGGEKSGCYIIEKEPLDVRCYMTGNSALADNEFIQVSEKTVGQYTGLKDKNGKKIFEGDILKEDDVTHNGVVQIQGYTSSVREDDGCWVSILPKTQEWDFLWNVRKKVEVVGNIHDNPELVEADS